MESGSGVPPRKKVKERLWCDYLSIAMGRFSSFISDLELVYLSLGLTLIGVVTKYLPD